MHKSELNDFSEALSSARSSRHLYMDSCMVKALHLEVEGFNFIYRSELSGSVALGVHSYINPGSRIRDVEIGRYCSIAEDVVIAPEQHSISMLSTHPYMINKSSKPDETLKRKRTIIGHDVWIGTGVVVMAGVNIGNGSVVGASSVVTKSLPPYSISVGSPAKVIKFRFSDTLIEKLQHVMWWNYSLGHIDGYDLNDVEKFVDHVRDLVSSGDIKELNLTVKTLNCREVTLADNMFHTKSRA